MLTLALDTTAEFGSIALLQDRHILSEILLHAPQGFSHVLFERIQYLLSSHHRKLADIDLFVAASGPGSFTGVRVGLAAAKGFAEVFTKPVMAVSNLRVLASFGAQPTRATVIDARRGEVYAAVYDADGSTVIEEQVVPFARFAAALPSEDVEWICADFAPFDTGQRYITKAPRALAAALGLVAMNDLERGTGPFPPEAIDANYVRRSDAELLFREA